jgi:hypothetical protein
MVRVISVSGAKSVLGVKVSVESFARHEPGVDGMRLGSGEPVAREEENVTMTAALAVTLAAPAAGVTEAMLSTAPAGSRAAGADELAPAPGALGVVVWLGRMMNPPTAPPTTSARTIEP